jgi:DNA polymerase sigma
MKTEKQKIEQQDFVDNAIFDLLNTLNPTDTELKWNIKPISEIREVIQALFVDELKLCTEDEFYP